MSIHVPARGLIDWRVGLAAILVAAVLFAPAAAAQSQLPGLNSWHAYPSGDGAQVTLAGRTSCNRPGRLDTAFQQGQALVIHIGSGMPPGQGCGFAWVPWQLLADFPNLPAGDYHVVVINNELYSPIAPLEVLRFDYQQPVLGLPTAVGVPAGSRIGWMLLVMLVVAGLCRRRVRDSA